MPWGRYPLNGKAEQLSISIQHGGDEVRDKALACVVEAWVAGMYSKLEEHGQLCGDESEPHIFPVGCPLDCYQLYRV